MMRKLAIALAVSAGLLATPVWAATEKAAVLKVVDDFFAAMLAKDEATLKRLAIPGAPLASVAPGKEGGFVLGGSQIETFAARVGQAPAPFNERYWKPQVLIDGRTAVVWTRYDFHRGKDFTHNGRDIFVMLKGPDGWKVVSLAYSTEPGGKTENPAGPPR